MEVTLMYNVDPVLGPRLAAWLGYFTAQISVPIADFRSEPINGLMAVMSSVSMSALTNLDRIIEFLYKLALTIGGSAQSLDNDISRMIMFAFYQCVYASLAPFLGTNISLINDAILSSISLTYFPHFSDVKVRNEEAHAIRHNMFRAMYVYYWSNGLMIDRDAFIYYKPEYKGGAEAFLRIIADSAFYRSPAEVMYMSARIPDDFGNTGLQKSRAGTWVFFALAIAMRGDIIDKLPAGSFMVQPYNPEISPDMFQVTKMYLAGPDDQIPSIASVTYAPDRAAYQDVFLRNSRLYHPILKNADPQAVHMGGYLYDYAIKVRAYMMRLFYNSAQATIHGLSELDAISQQSVYLTAMRDELGLQVNIIPPQFSMSLDQQKRMAKLLQDQENRERAAIILQNQVNTHVATLAKNKKEADANAAKIKDLQDQLNKCKSAQTQGQGQGKAKGKGQANTTQTPGPNVAFAPGS